MAGALAGMCMAGIPRTVRFRLIVGFLAVILLANALISVLTVSHTSSVLLAEVQTRVRLALNSAHKVYENHIHALSRTLGVLALSKRVNEAMATRDMGALQEFFDTVRSRYDMDMLSLLDDSGKVLYRSSNPGRSGDSMTANPIIAQALVTRALAEGTVLVQQDALMVEGEKLAQRARCQVLATAAAHPSDQAEETSGMVVGAAVPILDEDDDVTGYLYGANLLNKRYELVDTIKDEVFQGQSHEGTEIGTATIFQGDLRISTNVQTADGARAVGTRMSAEVFDTVIENGGVWADRAFVVKDWYITAYEPIRDPTGAIIGSLYVGLLEAPFSRPLRVIVTVFLAVVGVTTLASIVLAVFLTRSILKWEERLRAAARRQIIRSEKLASVGRLAAGIAHEINNPLTGVLTFSHLLQEKKDLTDEDRKDIDVIIKETTRVREIVQGLLGFARETPSRPEMLDLNDVVQRALKLTCNQKDFVDVKVVQELAPDLPRIQGDANQLQQVILNLALNAGQAMPHGGTLTVTTRQEGTRVVVSVKDTGVGISPEHLERIFEPFFTTKDPGKGTGLGLAVSYGIVEQHGGTLNVESRVGEGSVFTIGLPLSSDRHVQEGR